MKQLGKCLYPNIFPRISKFQFNPNNNLITDKSLNELKERKRRRRKRSKIAAADREPSPSAMAATKTWLSEIGIRVGNGLKRSLASSDFHSRNKFHGLRLEKSPTLGILAFETAKTMSRLLSLYKSLSNEEIFKLRKEIMRSKGVAYLNSGDEGLLLNLACIERLEELDRAAIVVARLGKKCSDSGLTQFDHIYSDLKFGTIDLDNMDLSSKEVEKILNKMERLISATSNLYSGLETLSEMETSERKLKQWKRSSCGMPSQKTNSELFDQKLSWQRQQVRHWREVSLWSQTFDKSVGLMARTVCIVYTRMCVVLGPYFSVLPRVSPRHVRFPSQPNRVYYPHSGPILDELPKEVIVISSRSGPISNTTKSGLVRFYSRESNPIHPDDVGFGVGFGIGYKQIQVLRDSPFVVGERNRLCNLALSSTVGGSGLALRYANVIILAEKYLTSASSISGDAREDLYRMLPASLKISVRTKLKNRWRSEEEKSRMWSDDLLAEGWREALKAMLEWLAPMAHDTLRWYGERNFEKKKFDVKPTVLLLQTLFFSDMEKTEAAISEVLVGLSCICRYLSRQSLSAGVNRIG